MPATPYARLLAAVNGGAPTAGGLTVAVGDVIQLSAESTVGWKQQRYEIYSGAGLFPLTVPAGWSTDGTTGAFFYSTTATPPPFTIPAGWGKLLLSLRVNDGADDSALYDGAGTALLVLPGSGLVDMCWGETTQFSTAEKWMAGWRADLRLINTSVAAGVSLAGDLLGVGSTTAVPRVGKINSASVPASGALTPGNVLQVSGVSALAYAPVNLAGGAAYVTGALPAGNQAAQAMGGDVTGTTAASVVAKVNGATYPAAGALTVGTVPRVTGASAVAYGALDLANVSAVTGVLAAGNQASQAMAGDVTGTTAASVVAKVNGTTIPAGPLTAGQVLRATGAATAAWGAVDLADADAVTGVLPVANTDATATPTAGKIVLWDASKNLSAGTGTVSTVASYNGPNNTALLAARGSGAFDLAAAKWSNADVLAVGDANNGAGVLVQAKGTGANTITLALAGASAVALTATTTGLGLLGAPSGAVAGDGYLSLHAATSEPTGLPGAGIVDMWVGATTALKTRTPKGLLATLTPETNATATAQRLDQVYGSVTTPDITIATIATYLLPVNCQAVFRAVVSGQQTGTDSRAAYTGNACTGRAAGSAAVDGVHLFVTLVDNIGVLAVPIFDTDGSNTIRIRVTGKLATSIDWQCHATVTLFSV